MFEKKTKSKKLDNDSVLSNNNDSEQWEWSFFEKNTISGSSMTYVALSKISTF